MVVHVAFASAFWSVVLHGMFYVLLFQKSEVDGGLKASRFKMAYCVLNNFSNQQKNILIMKDSTMPKKYTKQTSEKISNLGGRCDFRKFNSVSMNKSPRRIWTRDLRLTSPILQPLSYGNIRSNRSIQTISQNILIIAVSYKE